MICMVGPHNWAPAIPSDKVDSCLSDSWQQTLEAPSRVFYCKVSGL